MLEDMPLDGEEFARLLKLVLTQYDVGTIPVSLDQVQASQITRIDLRQSLRLGGGEFLPPAVRVGGPVLLPDPHGAVDVPGNDVILQLSAP